ncbi:hypothetical protein BLA24_26060 [Streptomyces cinnamoneus]|uniref:Uncharacterized protein n=1 Tax=Streptomyces cinnamoneus TaxID=53446 RepID=A0A2G1XE64_STRCJ|nr:hypothetical protein BLA24_26060 [Streptomyces cinnamoneus]PPT14847.1 hypothetical protein CYQ11_20005 [Streptomyces cinnamoneus]
MHKRKAGELQAKPTPPVGTVEQRNRPPGDVRIGDFLYLDGAFQRVRDMRAAGTSAHRVLHFTGRAPVIMREPRTIYRPLELL